MKNLVYLRDSYNIRLNNLINDKYNPGKSRILLLKPSIISRYGLYKRHFLLDTLHNLQQHTFLPQEEIDLISCYGISTASLGSLIADIKSAQFEDIQGTCQYCGIQNPNTIDHYLPQSMYPEFSVFPLNLFPCCGDCNTRKNKFWIKDNKRAILNFYIDKIPNIKFLHVNFSFNRKYNIPNIFFYLNIPNSIDDKLALTIQNHFERLELCNRYLDYVNDFISDKITSIICYLSLKEQSDIADRINQDSIRLEAKYGLNNWRAVLTKSMSLNTDFIDYIISLM